MRGLGAPRLALTLCAIALIQGALAAPAGAGPTAAAVARATPTTVTVMPFVPRSGQGQPWLSKGLADLLIQDLAQVKSLAIVSREQAQVFARELSLGDSPLFGPETALRMGRVAKVDRVLYGHYSLTGERIAITIFVLDMARQEVIQREDVEGSLRDLRPLVKRLAVQFTSRQGIELSDAERANIRFETTDSITATRHFYEGLHLYDQGRHADALGEFSAAAKQDPRYREAQLWMGKVFESLGSHEHAVVTYRALYRDAPGAVEGMDGLYFAGRVLEEQLKRRAEAIGAYQVLAKLRPISPQVLESAFRLGVLLAEEGRDRDAYLALRIVDDFHERDQKDPTLVSQSRTRASRFLGWPHALDLHRDAIVRMVVLYQRMTHAGSGTLPPAPRGVFVISPESPAIGERFGKTPALFKPRDDEGAAWRERQYAVVVPAGYVATGVEMTIRGRLVVPGPHFEYAVRVLDFPMPRDPYRSWLGVIYGQTPQLADLSKTITFNGDDKRLFTVQVFGGQAEIERWGLRVRLRRDSEQARLDPAPTPEQDGSFWEGRPAGRVVLPNRVVSGWTRPLAQSFRGPQKGLALSDDGRGGYVLVTAEGELDGQPTDLWWSRSADGTKWTAAAPLPINSASEDYNPRLVRAEDGTLWLYWISTRRGLGWDLWASASRDGRSWSDPQRVPLEQFVVPSPSSARAAAPARPITELLEYDVIQDRRGRWLLGFYSRDTRETVFIQSSDASQWTVLSRIRSDAVMGPALAEDRTGVFRLAALGPRESVYLWSSKDGTTWQPKSVPIDSPYGTPAPVHRTHLLPLLTGEMLLLVSDTIMGLQYARFQPDGEAPKLDRVSRAALEGFAVTPTRSGSYLVALRRSDDILVREYRAFNTTGVGVKKYERSWPIYMEEDRDRAGNRWRRMSARARMIVSDVTSVGVEPNGRVWWGIESGIMAKTGEEFFATDVSQGFFYHYVTTIKGCGGVVWFAADHLDRPVVGYVRTGPAASGFQPRFVTRAIPGASGAVTAAECGPNPGELYVGTSRGDVARVSATAVPSRWSLEGAPRITALTVEPRTGIVWVGTRDHGLFRIEGDTARRVSAKPEVLDREITALAVDAGGALWVALYENGLARKVGEQWTAFTPTNSSLPDWSIGRLAPGLTGGVWYIPHAEARSRGLGFFDGTRGHLHNPPHTVLDRPSSIAVDPRGHVWIGTWFDGLYELETAGAKK